jgi:PAS domain S-box-containing protein
MQNNGVDEELSRLRAQVAALEQLVEAQKQTIHQQSQQLQRTLRRLQEASSRLSTQEERTSFALEAAQMGIWEWDIQTGEVAWSPELEHLHGVALGTFGGTFEDYLKDVHAADRESVLTTIERSIEQESDYSIQYRIVRPDGALRWVEGKGCVLRDESVQALRMVGVCMDITARKEAEGALQESQERLRAVITRVPIILWAADGEGVVTFSEGKGLDTLGFRPGELVGQSIADLYRDWPAALESIHHTLCGEEAATTLEVQGVVLESRTVPLRDESDNVVGIIGVSLDVTQREQAAALLQESEHWYRCLVEATASGIVSLCRSGRITKFNPEAERLFGYRREEVLGKHYLELFPVERVGRGAMGSPEGWSSEALRDLEVVVRSGEGSERTLRWKATRLLDVEGHPVGVIATGQHKV